MVMQLEFKTAWVKARMCMMSALGAVALSCSPAAIATEWTFVWVGASASGWVVVQGTAVAKLGQDEIHFDLVGANAAKYGVDVQLKKNGTAVVGFAGLGDAYSGITILNGRFGKKNIGTGCIVETLEARNEFNSLSIGMFNRPGCKKAKS
jgi:hypothetical protein